MAETGQILILLLTIFDLLIISVATQALQYQGIHLPTTTNNDGTANNSTEIIIAYLIIASK